MRVATHVSSRAGSSRIRSLQLSLCLSLVCCSPVLGDGLPRSLPEAQGVSSSAILSFVQAADRDLDTMNSLMLVRHGHVIAEGWWAPYAPASRHELYSLSKSFTSTAVGMAVAEGRMSLDDTVLSHFPEDAPPIPGDKLKAMRVRDLLAMSTGHHAEDLAKFSFASKEVLTKAFLALPVAHKPGTHFLYNTPATYMLSAIVQKVAGMTVLDYLRPRLFEPLGIEKPTWDASAQGISLGGYGLSVRTEDIAKFGQLYLQKGYWNGRQLLPASWVEAATSRQASNGSNPNSDWDQGYGYQFWRCRHGAYRGDGAFGQYCLVMPEQDAVLAITSGLRDMQAVLDLVWKHLLPAMQVGALPPDDSACAQLSSQLKTLHVRTPAGTASIERNGRFAGRRYLFPANDQKIESLRIEVGDSAGGAKLLLRRDGTDEQIACGYGGWQKGRLAFGGRPERPMAASGAWTDEATYLAKICFYETPFYLTWKLQFSPGQVLFTSEDNVAFGSVKKIELTGRAE